MSDKTILVVDDEPAILASIGKVLSSHYLVRAANSARIMALADVFDALISKRVYKPAMSFDEARENIIKERNQHFDPDITDVFMEKFDSFVQIACRCQMVSQKNSDIASLNHVY